MFGLNRTKRIVLDFVGLSLHGLFVGGLIPWSTDEIVRNDNDMTHARTPPYPALLVSPLLQKKR